MATSSIELELIQTMPDPFCALRHEPDTPPTSPYLPTGHLIARRYVIIRDIGQGSMGVVYEAYDASISRPVAIKLLSPDLLQQPDCLERFRREWETASRISHENVCGLLDSGTCPDGTPYIVMELLKGMTLTELIARWGRLPEERIVPLALELLAGLDAAHRLGIIHRDVKPDNIFLDYSHNGMERLKLLDFGISKTVEESMALTRTGTVLGTPLYMSPEHIRGGKIDVRTDIWGVGIVLYEALTGRFPFDTTNFRALFDGITQRAPTKVSELVPGVCPHLEAVISKCLEKEPRQRYRDAADLSLALRAAMRARSMMM